MKKSLTTYLGIDPSLTSTGFAVYKGDEIETARLTGNKLRGVERLVWLRDSLEDALGITKPLPKVACVEDASLHSLNRSDSIGQWRGVALVTLADLDIEVFMVPPKSLKKFACGTGNASKEQMIASAKVRWGLTLSDDEADAAWLACMAAALKEPVLLASYQKAAIAALLTPKIPRQKIVKATKLDI